MTSRLNNGRRRPERWSALLLALAVGFTAVGCDSLIDVDNPNNVLAQDLENPAAAPSIANGALNAVQDGAFDMMLSNLHVSDEVQWVGSRDAWQELNFGFVTSVTNEFLDGAYGSFNQGRWMADKSIDLLEGFQADNQLSDEEFLGEAYLYGAYIYIQIANWFDDFTFSEAGTDGSPPIGPAQMVTLYDTAATYATNGLALSVSADLERNLYAVRAVARQQQAIWNLLKPSYNPGNGLAISAQAVTDAQDALNVDGTDWRYIWDFSASTVTNNLGAWINNRLESRFSDVYVIPDADNTRRDRDAPNEGVALLDPIDGTGITLNEMMTPFEDGVNYPSMTILSAREMHLIIAENALANNQMTTFQNEINAVRSADGLSDWTGAAGQPSAQDMLIYERQVNLFFQGRRFQDMYRFGLQSPLWQSTQPTVTSPGTFFPITQTEIDANCNLNPDFDCPS